MGPPQQSSQPRIRKQRKDKRHRGPRLPASLRRAFQSQKRDGPKSDDDVETEPGTRLPSDVYEYEENVAPEEVGRNSRYDEVDQLEYQLPSDFEDEEIEEDAASGEDLSDQLKGRHSEQKLERSSISGQRKLKKEFASDKEEQVEDDGAHTADEYSSSSDVDDKAKQQDSSSWEDDAEESENETDDDRHQRMVEAVTRYCVKDDRRKKVKGMAAFSEAYPESEFNVNPMDAQTSHQITVEDLMTPLQGTTGFGSLRKRMQQLQKRGAPVDVPLSKVVQERVDRQAGYEKTREEISKWQDIVKRNREAPTIVLTKRTDLTAVSTADLASKFEPTSNFEKEVASLLQECGVADGNLGASNTLEFNKLTVGEVKERQERLARMRSLLFYHEAKAKRIRKIKSKTFHWLQKKDRKTKLGLNGTKDDLDPEAIKEVTLKQEFRRAQERMTLKHKNTSKWAKRIIQRGLKAKKDGSRDAIAEQLRIHEALTRKIHSGNNASSNDDSSDEGADSGTGETDSNPSQVVKSRPRLLAKSKMETLKVLEGDAEAEIPTTGLFSLPFMARAIEKKRKQANDEALAVLEDLDQFESIDDRADGFGDAFQENLDVPQDLGVPSGRLAFGAMAKLQSFSKGMDAEDGLNMHVEDGSSSEDISEDKYIASTVRSSDKTRKEKYTHTLEKQNGNKNSPLSEILDDCRLQVAERVSGTVSGYLNEEQNGLKASIVNPWLFGELSDKTFVADNANGMIATKRDERKEDSKRIDVQKLSEENKMPDQTLLQERQILEPQVTIAGGENVVLSGVSANVKKNVSANKVGFSTWENPVDRLKSFDVANIEQSKMLGSAGSSDSDEEHENEGIEKLGFRLTTRNESQAELIQRAFAGDNVEADFEQLKSEALDEEVPMGETPLNLPGWGQWTDVQKKKGQPLWMLRKEEELKTKRNLALSKRKDCDLKHVIISEKLDKKAEKFLSPSLPFPYQSRETFERSIRMPIGREFNPDHAFRDMIRPSVIKHAGVIIDPIKYTMSEASNGRDSFSLPRKKRKGGERGFVSVYKKRKLDSPRFPKSNKVVL